MSFVEWCVVMRLLGGMVALAVTVLACPANAGSRAAELAVTGSPGHTASLAIPADTHLDIFNILIPQPGALVGPAIGDWTGLLLEDDAGKVIQGGFCARMEAKGVAFCLAVGDGPEFVHRGKYMLRVLGNRSDALRFTFPTPGLRSNLTVRAGTASPRGTLKLYGGMTLPAWNDSLTLQTPSEVVVGTAQVSNRTPTIGALAGAQCVSSSTLPCPPRPMVTEYEAYKGTYFVANGQEYPAGTLAVGDHAWLGAWAGTELSRFRFAVILPA